MSCDEQNPKRHNIKIVFMQASHSCIHGQLVFIEVTRIHMKDTFIYIFSSMQVFLHTNTHTNNLYIFPSCEKHFTATAEQLNPFAIWSCSLLECFSCSTRGPKRRIHMWASKERERGKRGGKGNSHNLQQHFVCIVTINLKCAGQDRSFEPTSSTACQLKWKCLSFRCNKRGWGVGGGAGSRKPT